MNNDYDVLIAGSGVAGLYAALNFAPDVRVLVLSKRELTLCNSFLAQGGVAAVVDKTNDEKRQIFRNLQRLPARRRHANDLNVFILRQRLSQQAAKFLITVCKQHAYFLIHDVYHLSKILFRFLTYLNLPYPCQNNKPLGKFL